MRKRAVALVLALAASYSGLKLAHAFQRSTLGWVADACEWDARITSLPFPCLEVGDLPGPYGGYAILREPIDHRRTILVALSDITGIEQPLLLRPDAPNFFEAAWEQRHWVLDPHSVGTPPPGFALAINSHRSRSQDRFHIHLGCLAPQAARALAEHTERLDTARFQPLGFAIHGHRLWAMRVDAAAISDFNPFAILAEKMPGARRAMGDHLLFVVPERLPDGRNSFVLLTNPVGPNYDNFCPVEVMLEPSCRANGRNSERDSSR